MKQWSSLPYSQQSPTGRYPETNSINILPTNFFKIYFNTIFLFTLVKYLSRTELLNSMLLPFTFESAGPFLDQIVLFGAVSQSEARRLTQWTQCLLVMEDMSHIVLMKSTVVLLKGIIKIPSHHKAFLKCLEQLPRPPRALWHRSHWPPSFCNIARTE
jgi:hypothetical protein